MDKKEELKEKGKEEVKKPVEKLAKKVELSKNEEIFFKESAEIAEQMKK